MRLVRFLFLLVIVVLVALAGFGWYLSSNYGDIVSKVALEQINQQLNSEVKVGKIEVSSWKKIPFFSLEFSDVVLFESKSFHNEPDTLGKLESIYLQFNLLDIYLGNYEVKKVTAETGFLRLKVNSKGLRNYEIWDVKPDTAETDFEFGLNEVLLKEIDLYYNDQSAKTSFESYCGELNLSGVFEGEDIDLSLRSKLYRTNLLVDNLRCLKGDHLLLSVGLRSSEEQFVFDEGFLELNESFSMSASGNVTDLSYTLELDGENNTLKDLLTFLPAKSREYLKNYQSSGLLDFHASISGSKEQGWKPLVRSKFELENGSLSHTDYPVELSQIFLRGEVLFQKNFDLILDSMHLATPSGSMVGNLKVSSGVRNKLDYSLRGNVLLEELIEIFPIEGIDRLQGAVLFNLSGISQWIDEFEFQENLNFKGNIRFDSVQIKPVGIPLNLQDLFGNIAVEPRDWKLKVDSGIIQSTAFSLKGRLRNLLGFWIDSSAFIIQARATFGHVRLEEFTFDMSTSSSEGPKGAIQFDIFTEIDSLSGGRFLAEDLSTQLYFRNDRLAADSLEFRAAGGSVNGRFDLQKRPSNSKFKFKASLSDVDIQRLFYEFNEFGQKEITSEHLRGRATAVGFVSGLVKQGEVDSRSIDSRFDLTINNGEIIGYQSLISISQYFKENLVLKTFFDEKSIEDKLKHVKFDQLQNQVSISDETIFIPEMSLSSSILDINAQGSHTFENELEYRMNFDLGDLMAKKRQFDTDYGYVTDDGTGRYRVFLKMYGKASDPVIEVDKERKRAYRKTKNKAEEKELKRALKKEFGLYRNDTSIDTEAKEPDFEVEWEESDKVETKTSSKNDQGSDKAKSKSEKRKGLKKLFEPIEHEKENRDDL